MAVRENYVNLVHPVVLNEVFSLKGPWIMAAHSVTPLFPSPWSSYRQSILENRRAAIQITRGCRRIVEAEEGSTTCTMNLCALHLASQYLCSKAVTSEELPFIAGVAGNIHGMSWQNFDSGCLPDAHCKWSLTDFDVGPRNSVGKSCVPTWVEHQKILLISSLFLVTQNLVLDHGTAAKKAKQERGQDAYNSLLRRPLHCQVYCQMIQV
ncbi:uncharacterized protein LOC128071666 [Tympanuchus pallidicinctus]|uniref:uncharacterized protein LOC128071666 n=1 Tax=Tympanuchus pallidicinctus TaxID=109042 RepID=UPI0022870DD6|nr:uncharacterized protein LOC128071666 [Tympanuchus pallidicinctus]